MIQPQHPSNYKIGNFLFDINGIKYKILDVHTVGGVVYATLTRLDIAKALFIEYDMHDYTGSGGAKLPEYFRTKVRV